MLFNITFTGGVPSTKQLRKGLPGHTVSKNMLISFVTGNFPNKRRLNDVIATVLMYVSLKLFNYIILD